jgi:hypothetical protein
MKKIFIFSFAASVTIYSALAREKTDFATPVTGRYSGFLWIKHASGTYKEIYMATLTVEGIGSNKIRVSSKDATTFELELKKQADKKIGGGDNNQCVYFEDYYTPLTRTAAHVNYTDDTDGVRWAFNGSRLGSLIYPPLITPQVIDNLKTLYTDDKGVAVSRGIGDNVMIVGQNKEQIKRYAYKLKPPFDKPIKELVDKIFDCKTITLRRRIASKKLADLIFEQSGFTNYDGKIYGDSDFVGLYSYDKSNLSYIVECKESSCKKVGNQSATAIKLNSVNTNIMPLQTTDGWFLDLKTKFESSSNATAENSTNRLFYVKLVMVVNRDTKEIYILKIDQNKAEKGEARKKEVKEDEAEKGGVAIKKGNAKMLHFSGLP